MQTRRPTPLAPAAAGLVHESSRTTVSVNRDPDTGLTARVIANSRLTLAWVAGELQVRCQCSTVALAGEQRPRPVRRM